MPSISELQEQLPRIMMSTEETLEEAHGERVGVAMFVFELARNRGTNIAYISNSDTDDVVAAIKQWIAQYEAGHIVLGAAPR